MSLLARRLTRAFGLAVLLTASGAMGAPLRAQDKLRAQREELDRIRAE